MVQLYNFVLRKLLAELRKDIEMMKLIGEVISNNLPFHFYFLLFCGQNESSWIVPELRSTVGNPQDVYNGSQMVSTTAPGTCDGSISGLTCGGHIVGWEYAWLRLQLVRLGCPPSWTGHNRARTGAGARACTDTIPPNPAS